MLAQRVSSMNSISQGSGGRWPSPPFVGKLRMRRVPLPVGIIPVCASEQLGAVQFAWLDKAADPHCFCPVRRVLVLEGSSPRQTLSGMGLAEAKLFRAC